MKELFTVALLVSLSAVGAACGSADSTVADSPSGAPPASATPSPAPAAATTSDAGPEPATVAELFPPGEARDAVLNDCGSCHNVACAAIGQRTAARWDSLKAAHKDRLPDPVLERTFAYLQEAFNDTKPEPRVPARFLEGGCTPF